LGCDSTTSPSDPTSTGPKVLSLSLSPDQVQFEPEDGFKDTTLVVGITTSIEGLDENSSFGYVIRRQGNQQVFAKGTFEDSGAPSGNSIDNLSVDQSFLTSTTSFSNFLIEVYAFDQNGNGNNIQTDFSISGFSNNRPVITDTTSPGTIIRPEIGSEDATFTATVTDADGDETISRVFLRIIDQQTGEVEGSPFDMADDGASLGDQTANDLVYTWSLPVTDTDNRPDRDYDIEFFALDQGGLYSDTLRTTFHIRGN
jgi:hypothetical protein